MRYRWTTFAIFAITSLQGCGGLVTRKVPLQARLSGSDYQKGFRYYTSRPHLIVSKPVLIGVTKIDGLLFKDEDRSGPDHIAIKVPTENGGEQFYDLSGKLMLELENANWMPFNYTGPMASLQSTVATADGFGGLFAAAPPQQENSPATDELPPPDELESVNNSRSNLVDPPSSPGTDEPEEEINPDPSVFQIVHLPDFEEQMAIRHKGCISQGSFALRFKDGWQLHSVQDSVDTTDVPIRLLQLAQAALAQATTTTTTQQPAKPPSTPAAGGSGSSNNKIIDLRNHQRVRITTKSLIQPGIYRLTKQSERSGTSVGGGILADLGIPTVEETQVAFLP
jgi:hypothetical protein